MKLSSASATVLGLVSFTQALPSRVSSAANGTKAPEVGIRACHGEGFTGGCWSRLYTINEGCVSFPIEYVDNTRSLMVKYRGADSADMHCNFWVKDSCKGKKFRVGNGEYAGLPKRLKNKLNSVDCRMDGMA